MSETAGSNLDPTTFDLDAWIDDVVRPEITVELYPYEAACAAKVAEIEAQIPAAEKRTDDDRGIGEATAAQLLAQLEELREERSKTALRVRIRQLTDAEIVEAAEAARQAKAADDDIICWSLAAACVEPTFTPTQLVRLRNRDRSGEQMVAQLVTAENQLMRGLPVPFSPAPSGDSLA